MKLFKIPFAYERYGKISVEADSKEEAIAKAEKILEEMTVSDMDTISEYLPDSEELDLEGNITEEEIKDGNFPCNKCSDATRKLCELKSNVCMDLDDYIRANISDIFRVIIPEDQIEDAKNVLDDASEWYDFDDGNRMMVHQDGLNALSDAEIEFEEV